MRIRRLRQARGYSLEQVAELLNMSSGSMSVFERGLHDNSRVQLGTLLQYADFYGVSMDYLLADTVRCEEAIG